MCGGGGSFTIPVPKGPTIKLGKKPQIIKDAGEFLTNPGKKTKEISKKVLGDQEKSSKEAASAIVASVVPTPTPEADPKEDDGAGTAATQVTKKYARRGRKANILAGAMGGMNMERIRRRRMLGSFSEPMGQY